MHPVHRPPPPVIPKHQSNIPPLRLLLPLEPPLPKTVGISPEHIMAPCRVRRGMGINQQYSYRLLCSKPREVPTSAERLLIRLQHRGRILLPEPSTLRATSRLRCNFPPVKLLSIFMDLFNQVPTCMETIAAAAPTIAIQTPSTSMSARDFKINSVISSN